MDDKEYELKKAELALREREVAAKENESKTSKWFSPLTIAIYVAALALCGNIFSTSCNNIASDRAEHSRSQSTLLLSVIKNDNQDETCKNLNFFVNIGLLDDPKSAIHNVCGATTGVPSLPTTSASNVEGLENLAQRISSGAPLLDVVVKVEDESSHEPIENARVGTGPVFGSSVGTDAKGIARLGVAFYNDNLTVSKEGYEPKSVGPIGKMQPQSNLANVVSTGSDRGFIIPLHRISRTK